MPPHRLPYWGPKRAVIMILLLHKPTTSLSGAFNVTPMDGRFREVLMYIQKMDTAWVCIRHGGRAGESAEDTLVESWRLQNLAESNQLLIQNYIFYLLAWRSTFLGKGKDWLAQCQYNVIAG